MVSSYHEKSNKFFSSKQILILLVTMLLTSICIFFSYTFLGNNFINDNIIHIRSLSFFSLTQENNLSVMDNLSIYGTSIIALIIMWIYIYRYFKNIYFNPKKLISITAMLALGYIFAIAFSFISKFLIPVALIPILMMLLTEKHISLVVNILNSVIIGVMLGFNIELLIITVITTFSTNIFLKHIRNRKHIVKYSIVIGLISTISYGLLINISNSQDMGSILIGMLFAFASVIISALLSIVFLPIFENLFDLVSNIKLLELSNHTNKLLKEFSLKAPGTYYHSIVVANLAEDAAEIIGANAPLARVGGYYHDIGKLKRPQFFKENQRGENPHIKLSKSASAQIIESHINDGIDIGKKNKLPNLILDLIKEHEGSTYMDPFYFKNRKINEEFRYSSPLPRSKESGIIFLANCVENAVSKIQNPSNEILSDVINKLFKEKLDDGQLNESDLTINELLRIKESFLNSLSKSDEDEYYEDSNELENSKNKNDEILMDIQSEKLEEEITSKIDDQDELYEEELKKNQEINEEMEEKELEEETEILNTENIEEVDIDEDVFTKDTNTLNETKTESNEVDNEKVDIVEEESFVKSIEEFKIDNTEILEENLKEHFQSGQKEEIESKELEEPEKINIENNMVNMLNEIKEDIYLNEHFLSEENTENNVNTYAELSEISVKEDGKETDFNFEESEKDLIDKINKKNIGEDVVTDIDIKLNALQVDSKDNNICDMNNKNVKENALRDIKNYTVTNDNIDDSIDETIINLGDIELQEEKISIKDKINIYKNDEEVETKKEDLKDSENIFKVEVADYNNVFENNELSDIKEVEFFESIEDTISIDESPDGNSLYLVKDDSKVKTENKITKEKSIQELYSEMNDYSMGKIKKKAKQSKKKSKRINVTENIELKYKDYFNGAKSIVSQDTLEFDAIDPKKLKLTDMIKERGVN